MSEKYDVVIVGAGIGGLVCGCYLVKSGLKVLMVEQHYKPGGYCTSFTRKGYGFDAGVHYLGSLKKGILRRVFDELDLEFPVEQTDPSDRIILPDVEVCIRANVNDTIEEFKKSFPSEKINIDKFFAFILADDFFNVFLKTKNATFLEVLDSFFLDKGIKASLSLLLGNIGLSAGQAAAVPAIVLFREYIFDCGYYPVGGMQSFADALASRFKNYGGELMLGKKVVRIVDGSVKKIILESNESFDADSIVSNADATLTYKSLLGVESRENSIIDRMVHSPSMFLVYLGLKTDLSEVMKNRANIWFFSSYDIDQVYTSMAKSVPSEELPCVMCSFPSMHDKACENKTKSTAIIFIHAPYNTDQYWESEKISLGERLVNKASLVIPGLKESIDVMEYATPSTFYKYTLNKDGSFVGWLSTLKQINSSLISQCSSIGGIYLVGHWTSMGYPGYGGIPNVAFSGRRGAMVVLLDKGIKWGYGEIKL